MVWELRSQAAGQVKLHVTAVELMYPRACAPNFSQYCLALLRADATSEQQLSACAAAPHPAGGRGHSSQHCDNYHDTTVQTISLTAVAPTPTGPSHPSLERSRGRRGSGSCALKLMSIELVMPSSHLILCRPLLLLLPIPPSIRVFSNESTLRMRWPKYWSFSLTRASSAKTRGFHTQLDEGPETP